MDFKKEIAEVIKRFNFEVETHGFDHPRVKKVLQDPNFKESILIPEISCLMLGCEEDCEDWHSLLHKAAFHGNDDLVKKLIEIGVNVNAIQTTEGGKTRMTALHYAVEGNQTKIIQVLLESGGNVDIKGSSRWSFATEMLCDSVMMLKYCDLKDKTPLEFARQKNYEDCVEILENFSKNSIQGAASVAAGSLVIAKLETATKFIQNLTTKREQLEGFSDVQVICKRKGEETVFNCHKFILATCSPVFFQMLENEDSEESKSGRIVVKDISVHTMKQFLDFLYQDGLENVALDDVGELMKVADRYKVDGLKTACEQELMKMVSQTNCVFMLHLAKKHGANKLEVTALDLVIGNLAEVRKSKDFILLMQDFPDALYESKQ